MSSWERWVNEQKWRGNKGGAQSGRSSFGDVLIPNDMTAKEVAPIEVKRFTDEASSALIKEGFIIHDLTGRSIASLRKDGRKFWSSWHKDYPQLETLTSIHSQVAINPNQLWIPRSNHATLLEQEEMIGQYSEELSKKVPGVDAIMGSLADYTDLVFTLLDNTGEHLFGEKHRFSYARTNTLTVGGHVAGVGNFRPDDGLDIYHWDPNTGLLYVYAAPLIIPKTV